MEEKNEMEEKNCIVVRQYADGQIFVCEPHWLMDITEATAVVNVYQANKKQYENYFIMEVSK